MTSLHLRRALLCAAFATSAVAQEPSNRLIHEKSPYLLQHAHNPVDWYPWGAEAFEKARKENKPIFLSIGYSTCHWCHVMEHESFENPVIAKILNDHFVAIKVDREERPDVDSVYMTFVQATTGSGGWPMSVWLTPDLKPFVGGTYLPPQQFTAALNKIADAWKNDRARIVASSDEILSTLQKAALTRPNASVQLSDGIEQKAYAQLASAFDPEFGGFGPAPKFPRPVIFNFLDRIYAAAPDSKDGKHALEMTLVTLRKMASGGIHDQLGGGFHRYSTDKFWHVPHFEKMLYDQAQLAVAYLNAFQITREPIFEQTARDILDYVRRDMTGPGGGFYSAEDADSLLLAGQPEHAEGAFYVWTKSEIDDALGAEPAKVFDYFYGVEAKGNAPEDPQGEFKNKNILIQRHSLSETAKEFKLSEEKTRQMLAESRQHLLELRAKRPCPRVDDKIVTAWNGLMISAFARASQVLGDPAYLAAANKAADFARQNLYDAETNTLRRSYRGGASDVHGFASDYAFLIQGLLDLYAADFDVSRMEWAMKLQEQQNALFWDEKNGGYFSTSGQDNNVLLRMKEGDDGAEPSPNSVAALNLLRLSAMLDKKAWQEQAEKTLHAFDAQLNQAPAALPQMLVALDWSRAKPKQIVIAGKPDAADTAAMLREVRRHFIPNKVLILADGGAGQKFFAAQVEFMKDIAPIDGNATAYVCENFICQLPVTDPEKLQRLLVPKRAPAEAPPPK
ncbi:MAG: thioredoxin domain-containing protein [Chthoniobacterales bacterium]